MAFVRKSKLPRLPREFYQGGAIVLWTHTFENRAKDWLNEAFHAQFREVLLHTCARYDLACPAYVLMPDHWHIVWMGLSEQSDQKLATAFLREHLSPRITGATLQDRAHDHVLREADRERGAFEAACEYVRNNPVRASLMTDWKAWPFLDSMIPGYPVLNSRMEDFWERFWKIYNRLVERR